MLLFGLAWSALSLHGATNYSSWVIPGSSGRLLHQPDAMGNRILDYSGVGYQGDLVPIPVVPVKTNLSPVAGDNVARIQAAINYVSSLPIGSNGFRGAVLLSAGEFPLANTLRITASGVVLRGSGSGPSGTILRATASSQYTLVSIAGSGSSSNIGGTTHNITNRYVPVGARSFQVDSTSGLAVGDRVFVRRVATSDWIHDLGMDLLCCPPDVNPWTPSGYHIDADRLIKRIEGNRIFIDAPITTAIDRAYTNGTIRKYVWPGRIQNSGIENLRGVSNFTNSTDENHGWIFVQFNRIEHGWARDLVSQYFGYACVALSSGAKWVTVDNCQSLNPVSQVTGGRRYAFVLDDCTMCLVKNCYNHDDRHQFVTQSLTTGPNVFVDGVSDSARSDCGPHHRWGSGAIWDNITVNGHNLNIQNRGNSGSGHGWAGANEVVWNSDADGGFVVQNPPTARNWLIGSIGTIENGTGYVGPHDPGTYDSHGSNVFPNSLYYAQLQDRLAGPNLQTREYWLGEIGKFTNSYPGGEVVPVDAAWRTAVQSAAGGSPLSNFDVVSNTHWVPFTFNFIVATNEQIVGATLAVSLLGAGGGASNDVIYLDSLTNSRLFSALGWLPISSAISNPSVRVLDLSSQLHLLADGRLNLALQNDVGIDWALLEVHVAPKVDAGILALLPVADATVRGGASAGVNFGAATTLSVREDPSADNDRRAYLRWDLSSVTGIVYQAKIRLTPTAVGTNGIEQGVAFTTNDVWTEAGITWNSQPGGGKRFATWIPGANAPIEANVTPQVLDALAGDKQLSVQLLALRNFGNLANVDYGSREHPDTNSRPQLLLLVSELPPVISDVANISIPVNGTTGPVPFTVGDDKTPAGSLLLTGTSSDTNLVPTGNIVFGGSDSNRTVTVTPTPNQSGFSLITIKAMDGAGLTGSEVFNLTVSSHPPGVFIWNGPGAGANPWSTANHWLPAGPPESLDEVKFFDAGATGVGVSNINNAVDNISGGTVASVHFGNTNGNHTTLITPGKTLSLVGGNGLTVGTETDNGNTQAVHVTITGVSAGLNLNGGDLTVRQATGADTSGTQRATLNMSGLDRLDAAVGRVVIGSEGLFPRVTGTLQLPRTNLITASGVAPSLAVGGLGGGNGNGGGASFLHLGMTNAIFADSLAVGRGKQSTSSGATSLIRFNQAFTNANPNSGPMAYWRNVDGSGRMSFWSIADSGGIGGTVNAAGACDFTGGRVDALVNTIVVGKTSTGTGNGKPTGTLTLAAGIIDVNTLQLAQQSSAGSNSATAVVRINGGTLAVNNAIDLGITSGGVGAVSNSATLTINGATVRANTINAATEGHSAITVDGGQLIVTNQAGSPLVPIRLVALSNAVLELSAKTNGSALCVSNLVTGPGVNSIRVSAFPITPVYPAQFRLIEYTGTIQGSGYNFALMDLPEGAICGAYLSNNLVANSIDLVVTNCIIPDAFLTWDGSINGDWDTQTANWKNNVSAGLMFNPGDSVVFNDNATGPTDINLTETLTASSVTVSNQLKTYAFVDLGKLSGGGSLSKQGAGTLILANEAINDWTGGTTIAAGTLRVGTGGTNGTIAAGNVVNNASLVFNRSDDLTAANAISGSGTVTKAGAGTLTLASASTFNGAALIGQGKLKAGNTSALGSTSGSTVISNGATLDVNGLNLGLEPVVVSGNGVGGLGAIVNETGNPGFLNPNLAYVTLTGPTTFGGTGRWDLRSASTTVTNAALSTGGQPFKLTKVGTNQVSLVAVAVDPALGDIDVVQGVFSVEKVTTSLGNPAASLTISNGATLQFFQVSNVLNKVLVMRNGATVLNNSGANTFGGPMTLQGSNIFNAGGASLRFTNTLAGTGSLHKTGNALLILSASNVYSGGTLVNAGTLMLTNDGSISTSSSIYLAPGAFLDVSGRSDGKLTLSTGQTLSGHGTVHGSLHVSPGAMVSPGPGIGALTVTNAVALQGATLVELNKIAATNDVLRGITTLTYGGTLSLSFTPGSLAVNDSFRLFYAAGYTGAFTNIVPGSPGPGLAWDTSLLTINGTIRVGTATSTPPTITKVGVSGSTLVFEGSGGTAGATYYVLSSTNIETAVGTWTRLATNQFTPAGTFTFSTPFLLNSSRRFYMIQVP